MLGLSSDERLVYVQDESNVGMGMYVVCPKSKCTVFYLNAYWTHLKLQVISFKV